MGTKNNNQARFGMEKAETKIEILRNGAATDFVRYATRYKKEIEKHEALKNVLDDISPIDFLNAYYADNQDVWDYIYSLREKIQKKENVKESEEILKDLDPSTECKMPIIIENLLSICERQNTGIGIINGKTYYYNGCYWSALDEKFVRGYLTLVAERSGLSHFQVNKVKFLDLLYKQLVSSAQLPISKPGKEVKINLKNGTFKCNENGFEFCPFSPDDYLTYQLPFEYNPEAKAPKFKAYIEYAITEKEARDVVAEYLAYIFAKHLRWEKCLVLLGSGGNGKSVLIDIITALLGEQNVTHFPITQLCDASGYYRAEIEFKLLNVYPETNFKGANPQKVKALFSNDPIEARSPYGKPISISNYCRFLFSSNGVSNKDIEQTDAYFRRFLFLEFNAPVPKEKKNTNLAKEIIREELSGVFNWILEGLRRIMQEGRNDFTYSPLIQRTNESVEKSSNNVAIFMDEENYRHSTNYVNAKDLYQEYVHFCETCKYVAVSKIEFLKRLEKRLRYKIKRKATNGATWVYCEKIYSLNGDEKCSDVLNFDVVEKFVNKA